RASATGPFRMLASGLGTPAPGRPCGLHHAPATAWDAHCADCLARTTARAAPLFTAGHPVSCCAPRRGDRARSAHHRPSGPAGRGAMENRERIEDVRTEGACTWMSGRVDEPCGTCA